MTASSDDSTMVVRRRFQAFNDGDLQAEEAARTADFVAHVPGMTEPLDGLGWRRFIAAFVGSFPDMRLVVEDI